MMAERWRDVGDDLSSSRRHFAEAVALFRRNAGHMSLAESYLEVMAFQHAMQAGYTSFESALRRLLAFLDEALPQGSIGMPFCFGAWRSRSKGFAPRS